MYVCTKVPVIFLTKIILGNLPTPLKIIQWKSFPYFLRFASFVAIVKIGQCLRRTDGVNSRSSMGIMIITTTEYTHIHTCMLIYIWMCECRFHRSEMVAAASYVGVALEANYMFGLM